MDGPGSAREDQGRRDGGLYNACHRVRVLDHLRGYRDCPRHPTGTVLNYLTRCWRPFAPVRIVRPLRDVGTDEQIIGSAPS